MGVFLKKHRMAFTLPGCCAALTLLYMAAFSGVSAEGVRDALLRYGDLAPVIYMLLFYVLPAFFFPVAVLAFAGGLLFGLLWGSVYTFIGAVINCALMFFLARRIGREKIRALVQRKLPSVWQARLKKAGGRKGFLLLIILRLIPAVPYNLINYAFGLTEMPFAAYVLGSAIGIIPRHADIYKYRRQGAGRDVAILLDRLRASCAAAAGRNGVHEQKTVSKQRQRYERRSY